MKSICAEQNIGFKNKKYTPEERYFIRFLKENDLLKKFMFEFNTKKGLKYRCRLYTNHNTDEAISLSEFIKKLKKTRGIKNITEDVIDASFNWEETKDGFDFWEDIWNFLTSHRNETEQQILRLIGEKNIFEYDRPELCVWWY